MYSVIRGRVITGSDNCSLLLPHITGVYDSVYVTERKKEADCVPRYFTEQLGNDIDPPKVNRSVMTVEENITVCFLLPAETEVSGGKGVGVIERR